MEPPEDALPRLKEPAPSKTRVLPRAAALHPATSAAASVLAVACIYLLTLGLLERQGFWVIDNANKFLQLRGILDSGYRDWSIPWRGGDIDPGFLFQPLPYAFSQVSAGRLYSVFPPLFAALAAGPYRLFGFDGLYVLPLGFAVLTLIATSALVGRLGGGIAARHVAVWITGIATPIWFYAVVFWEHTLAASACVAAVVLTLRFVDGGDRRGLAAAFACAAAAVSCRDELYLFVLALALAAALHGPRGSRRTLAVALGTALVCWLPLWLFQWATLGEPLGFHLARNLRASPDLGAHLAARPQVFYNLVAADGGSPWRSCLLVSPHLVLLCTFPWWTRSKRSLARILPWACLAAVPATLYMLAGFVRASSPIAWLDLTNSLFVAAPMLVLAFLPRSGRRNGVGAATAAAMAPDAGDGSHRGARTARSEMCLWTVVMATIVLYGLGTPELSSKGLHWGNRYLSMLYPLLAAPAALRLVAWGRTLRSSGRWRWLAVGCVTLAALAGVLAQLESVRLLRRKLEFSQRLNQEVLDRPEEVVVTDVPWAGQELYAVFAARPLFFAATEEKLQALLARLAARRVPRFLFVTRPGAFADGTTVDDNGLNYFSLQLVPLENDTGP